MFFHGGAGCLLGATGSDVTSGIFLFPLSLRPFLTKEKEERERFPAELTSFPVAPVFVVGVVF
jgi:hypothetical protein